MEYVPHGIGFPAEDARKLERELAAVTEQRDELVRQNKLFRNETLICADCDALQYADYVLNHYARDSYADKLVEQLRGYDKHLRVCMGWTMRASELEVSGGMQEAQLADLKAAESFLANAAVDARRE
jgi:hypothetical protein